MDDEIKDDETKDDEILEQQESEGGSEGHSDYKPVRYRPLQQDSPERHIRG